MLSQSDSGSRFGKPTSVPTRKRAQPDLSDTLTFVQSLQSSLELEVILPILLDRIRLVVPGCRLLYTNQELDINLKVGGPLLKNQCFYQLKTEQQNLGEIRVSNSAQLLEPDLRAIEDSLSHLLYPLRNAMLYLEAIRSARLDALTGVGNRFAFSRAYEREHALAVRHKNDLSLLILDIDHFKKINDCFGHLAGDQVLKEVASALQDAMRQTDMIFRYGGEEFTAILTKTDGDGARVIAERIRRRVEALTILQAGERIRVTISIGIGSLNDANNDRQMFEIADNNLYLAKRNGRNQVCF